MTRVRRFHRHLARLLGGLFVACSLCAAVANAQVVVLEVNGAIGAATADYLESGLEHARETSAELVIVRMDTPGGLVSSMRDIVQDFLASPIPIATYVTPAGARADSAGTFILFASHIAAMTPTTHLGAATPVSITGEDIGSPPGSAQEEPAGEPSADDAPAENGSPAGGSAMNRKVMNDAVAYIRSLAQRYGRNADWAEKAVTEAATLTATEALENNVIEFIAADQADLLRQLDGHEVALESGPVTLATADAVIDEFEPNWRIKLLAVISNPEIVLLLGLVGVYGLMYEGWNPGAIVPGVVGVICLLLAGYALQVIPVNYAGLALIIVGIALMVAEAFAPSFGALGLGGIAAFVFGAIMMFDSGVPGFGISIAFVLAIAIVAAGAIGWTVSYLLKLRRRGAVSGTGSIVGGIGNAMEDFSEAGRVWLEGEAWAAHSTAPVVKGQEVIVRRMEGLTLEVEPLPSSDPSAEIQTQN